MRGSRRTRSISRAADSFRDWALDTNELRGEEALQLGVRGCTIDLTAYPAGEGNDAGAADEAVARYLEADLPSEHITVSSDGGGCLPMFDEQSERVRMGIGRPG